jgi:hypothetical protein
MTKREISVDEQLKIDKGLQRWWPELVPSYQTSIYNMLSSPVKSTLIMVIIVGIFYSLYMKYRGNIYNKRKLTTIPIQLTIISVGIIIISYITIIRRNGNIIGLLPYLSENPTYYEYKQKLPMVDIIKNGNSSTIIPIVSSSKRSRK